MYRAELLPDAQAHGRDLETGCREAGLGEIYLAAVQSFERGPTRDRGASTPLWSFPPHGPAAADRPAASQGHQSRLCRLSRTTSRGAEQVSQPPPPYPATARVMPSWDNSPRRAKRAHVCLNGSPEAYGRWLEAMVEQTLRAQRRRSALVFVNAWNEWAEGNYLEPDRGNGHAHLEATGRGLCRGMAAHFERHGFRVTEQMVERALMDEGVDRAEGSAKMKAVCGGAHAQD